MKLIKFILIKWKWIPFIFTQHFIFIYLYNRGLLLKLKRKQMWFIPLKIKIYYYLLLVVVALLLHWVLKGSYYALLQSLDFVLGMY